MELSASSSVLLQLSRHFRRFSRLITSSYSLFIPPAVYLPPCASDSAFVHTMSVYKFHLLTYYLRSHQLPLQISTMNTGDDHTPVGNKDRATFAYSKSKPCHHAGLLAYWRSGLEEHSERCLLAAMVDIEIR